MAPSAADDVTNEQDRRLPVHADCPPIIARVSDTQGHEPQVAGAPVPKTIVPRWLQVTVLALGILVLSGIASAIKPVLVIFLVASIVGLILNPIAARVADRLRIRRGFAVIVVYAALFLILLAIGALLANPVADQVTTLRHDFPRLSQSAGRSLGSLQSWLDSVGLRVHIREQGQSAVQVIQRQLLASSGDVLSFSQSLLQSAATISFALILVFVISVYMLLYAESIDRIVRSVMPPGDGSSEDDYPTAVQRAVYGYVRGQALFSLVMGTSAGLAMWLAGVVGLFPQGRSYAVVFGAFYGLMELVPFIGPVLGAVPPILVALINHPIDAVWVGLIFLALQQIEGHFVAPQLFGHTLRINPLLILFALLVGAELYGVVGALLALPIAAVGRETVIYLRRHVVLEPWGTSMPPRE